MKIQKLTYNNANNSAYKNSKRNVSFNGASNDFEPAKSNKMTKSCLIISAVAIFISLFSILNNKKTQVNINNLKQKIDDFSAEISTKIATDIDKAVKKSSLENYNAQKNLLEMNIKSSVEKFFLKTKEAEKITQNSLCPQKQNVAHLKDIVFKKGIAYNPDGTNFSGVIEDCINNKNIQLTYKNGEIQQAVANSVEKTYVTRTDSLNRTTKIIKINPPDEPEKIKKIITQKDQLTLKEYVKNYNNNTKMQTFYFNANSDEYIKVNLENNIQRQHPLIQVGDMKHSQNKRIALSQEYKTKYALGSVDDDGFGVYQLFIEKNTSKPIGQKVVRFYNPNALDIK